MAQSNDSLGLSSLEKLVDPVVIYDREWRVWWVNGALAELYRQAPQQFVGQHCFRLFHGRQSVCEDCSTMAVLRSGQPSLVERFWTLPDGRKCCFETYSYPVINADGEVVQIIQYARDISKRKQLEAELRATYPLPPPVEVDPALHAECDDTSNRVMERTLTRYARELEKANSKLQLLVRISNQVNARGSTAHFMDSIRDSIRQIVPDSEPLFFISNAHNTDFLHLTKCTPGMAEKLEQTLRRLEQAGQTAEFVRYLEATTEQQVLGSEDRTQIPAFLKIVVEGFRHWFGFPLLTQGRCIGYVVVGFAGRRNCSFEDIRFLQALFDQAAGHLRHLVLYEAELEQLRQQVAKRSAYGEIIGQSKRMQEIYELIDLVAGSDATVLITGENGTGKELVAKAIHTQSRRSRGPFVVASCSAYSPTLLESELFGHEKGAFTGAVRQTKGRIERAHHGTLFLDEIGDIAPAMQILLLRFLQDHRFERVGGEKTIQSDVRVLAATNRDLTEAVRAGRFRDDLYYRLNVISIQMPPLRHRKEDIPLLAQHFLHKYNFKEHRKIHKLSSESMQALMDYDWPGNVRQLENAISHAVVLCQDEVIRKHHLPKFLKTYATEGDVTSLAENERRLVLRVLRETNWNKHQAARRLQMSRSTLYSKIRRYKLDANSSTG